jgi:hypothetical protein
LRSICWSFMTGSASRSFQRDMQKQVTEMEIVSRH